MWQTVMVSHTDTDRPQNKQEHKRIPSQMLISSTDLSFFNNPSCFYATENHKVQHLPLLFFLPLQHITTTSLFLEALKLSDIFDYFSVPPLYRWLP